MKIFRNKVFLGVLCIVVGLVAGFVILPAFTNNAAETRPVPVIKMTVQAGTQLTADMIATQELPKSAFPDALTNPSDAVGKYATANLYAGDVLTAAKLSSSLEAMDAMAAASEKGKQVVSLTLPNLAAGVSGRLLPGDVVAVMATAKNANQSLGLDPDADAPVQTARTMVVPGLEALEVCMVTTNAAADAHVSARPSEGEKNELPVTVSFYVTPEQALLLAALEQNSTIHLAFVARGESAAAYIPEAGTVLVGTEAD
jgi:pilus assembly protein CpaB